MASTMETINQLASSAAKAVWGDSNPETHEEPRAAGQAIAIGPVVSGATGYLRWGSR